MDFQVFMRVININSVWRKKECQRMNNNVFKANCGNVRYQIQSDSSLALNTIDIFVFLFSLFRLRNGAATGGRSQRYFEIGGTSRTA